MDALRLFRCATPSAQGPLLLLCPSGIFGIFLEFFEFFLENSRKFQKRYEEEGGLDFETDIMALGTPGVCAMVSLTLHIGRQGGGGWHDTRSGLLSAAGGACWPLATYPAHGVTEDTPARPSQSDHLRPLRDSNS